MDTEKKQQRKISDSLTEQIHVIRPAHLNGAGKLFGGQLAMWIDEVAGISAMRYAGGAVVTVVIDNLRFREPVHQNELLVLKGRVTYVGNTSMEVRVDSYTENIDGARRLINTAFVILVALDDGGVPRTVPRLIIENDTEKAEFDAGKKRQEIRKEQVYR